MICVMLKISDRFVVIKNIVEVLVRLLSSWMVRLVSVMVLVMVVLECE